MDLRKSCAKQTRCEIEVQENEGQRAVSRGFCSVVVRMRGLRERNVSDGDQDKLTDVKLSTGPWHTEHVSPKLRLEIVCAL